MFSIDDDGNMKLTRGDTARFNSSIVNDVTKTAYTLASGDKLTMTVRKNSKTESKDYVFKKELTGSSAFLINPSDTKDARYGKYIYDIQLTLSNGEVYTVTGPNTFEITEEATY